MTTAPQPDGTPGETAPENRPAPLPTLVDDVTPAGVHYRRNHFPYPSVDPASFRLTVTGAVTRPREFTLADLATLPPRTATVLLECAGHRRTEFTPPISGVQWGLGALSQAEWGGVPLADVLERTGIAAGAVEVVLHGADAGTFGDEPGTHTFSRSLPLAKALHPDTLLVTTMNGAPLPREHGAPLRAVVPGWYAMDSVKWLTSIEVVTEPFRGVFQELDYRFQGEGETGIGARIDEMRIHALITSHADADRVAAGPVEVTGVAWSGHGVGAVEVRVDNGEWVPASVMSSGPYQRALWSAEVDVPAGRHVLAIRATDPAGRTQPDAPIWNRRGYVNNSVQYVSLIGL